MTKSEVLAELRAKNELDSARKSPAWLEAFRLYNEAHPQAKRQPNCGSCYTKVKNWLLS